MDKNEQLLTLFKTKGLQPNRATLLCRESLFFTIESRYFDFGFQIFLMKVHGLNGTNQLYFGTSGFVTTLLIIIH